MSAERRNLREILRAGDPYDGSPMPAADVTRIKAQIRAAADAPVRSVGGWSLAAAAMAGVALVAVGLWVAAPETSVPAGIPNTALDPTTDGTITGTEDVTSTPAFEITVPESVELVAGSQEARLVARRADALVPPAAIAAAPAIAARHVRMTAPRGTRIIWTLDPAFDTPETTLNGDDDRLQGADPR